LNSRRKSGKIMDFIESFIAVDHPSPLPCGPTG
jgi:hypothetical protein